MNFSYNNFPMGATNGFNGNNAFGNYIPQMQTPMQYAQYQMSQNTQPMPPRTNKIFVTSLEDAMSKPAEPNTEIIYLHQTEPLLFQIYTDMQGKKSASVFTLAVAQEKGPEPNPVSRKEFDELKAKIEELTKGGNVNE